MPKYSLLIPMYRSGRFINYIRGVIDSHLDHDCNVLLSDQHLLDDAAMQLQTEYSRYPQVRIFTSRSDINWVENINLLISKAETDFIRIAPHDDTTTGEQSDRLLKLLLEHPEAVIATGAVRHIPLGSDSSEGKIIKAKLDPSDRYLDNIKRFNDNGLFNGAFKGMIRKTVIDEYNLPITVTPTTILSERLWLNALRMVGPFVYSPEVMHTKRLYKESTHRQWKYTRQVAIDNAIVMSDYVDRLIGCEIKARTLKEHFWQRAYKQHLERTE